MLTEKETKKFVEIVNTGGDTEYPVNKTIDVAIAAGKATKDDIFFYETNKPNGFMCNFFKAPQVIAGQEYMTNEHFYQASKAATSSLRLWIATCPLPFHAMKAGRALREAKGEIIPNWDDKKFNIMLTGVRAKFYQNPALALKLLNTGTAPIHEASPIDLIWGVLGEDKLGKVLMAVRDELRRMTSGYTLEEIAKKAVFT